jgi:putative endonuclease
METVRRRRMPSEALREGGRLKYVYLLRSSSNPSKTYIGLSDDPARRLDEHNSSKSNFTSRHIPWKLEVLIGFEDTKRAVELERYLKSGSGISFARRYLW